MDPPIEYSCCQRRREDDPDEGAWCDKCTSAPCPPAASSVSFDPSIASEVRVFGINESLARVRGG